MVNLELGLEIELKPQNVEPQLELLARVAGSLLHLRHLWRKR